MSAEMGHRPVLVVAIPGVKDDMFYPEQTEGSIGDQDV